jgi:hypothetical protein
LINKKLQSPIYLGIEASHSDDPRGIRTQIPTLTKFGGDNRECIGKSVFLAYGCKIMSA